MLELTYVAVNEVTPHPDNARQGDVEAIRESVRANGVYRPLVVQRSTGYILAGNHSYKAQVAEGVKSVPVVYVDVDDEGARRIMLADNRTADLGGYDEQALVDLLESLDSLAGTGYAAADLDSLLADLVDESKLVTDPDEVPDAPDEPISQFGDVFVLGRHRVVCRDAAEVDSYEAVLGESLAAMVWTDPPYGVEYVGRTADALTIENDGPDGLDELLHGAFRAALGAVRPGAPVYVAHADTARITFESTLRECGVLIRQNLVWVKNQISLGRSDYQWRHEPVLYGFTPGGSGRLGRGSENWHGDNSASTVFEVDKPLRNGVHPTMKPVDLIRPMIVNSSAPGEIVLDMFGGSGSTLVAAHLEGRRAALIELDPRYVDVICRRYQELTGELPIRESTGDSIDFGA